eukprot:gnl/TRDRNA2_/TRDRNA2_165411_c0_seq3.p1 gnl/TRDRNA2_/TRDRNA2_165411_c0~~gnl/TRDRNA2_/TRDRNA2_165411_c0_seq3.p1  ORF type:complete len:104 (-),score=7.27 gnl/TRDRNA2_/TRDRNA2_165411_c0_seq3:58-369(-)
MSRFSASSLFASSVSKESNRAGILQESSNIAAIDLSVIEQTRPTNLVLSSAPLLPSSKPTDGARSLADRPKAAALSQTGTHKALGDTARLPRRSTRVVHEIFA